mgnify:CR=1 FL=1
MLVNPGYYAVTAVFHDRKGALVTQPSGGFYVYENTMLDEALKNARSWISMTGLHNFGMRTRKQRDGGRWQEIAFRIVQVEGPRKSAIAPDKAMKFASRCRVNESGHIVP